MNSENRCEDSRGYILRLQKLFDHYQVKFAYLISYWTKLDGVDSLMFDIAMISKWKMENAECKV